MYASRTWKHCPNTRLRTIRMQYTYHSVRTRRTVCTDEFRTTPPINTNYFPKHNQPTGSYKGDAVCSLRGTNSTFIFDLDKR